MNIISTLKQEDYGPHRSHEKLFYKKTHLRRAMIISCIVWEIEKSIISFLRIRTPL